ncbi:MAG: glycosyltransferase family 4 protein [Candidatus Omnitrophica bacterium]|nr:glycosyltransferase family 4 protein [Candidatus Omnitrophota bacterium]
MKTPVFQKIILLGNSPADQQWSILEYGKQLHLHLQRYLDGDNAVELIEPSLSACLASPWARQQRLFKGFATYWTRYHRYPSLLKGKTADIFHILDNGNSCLIRYTNPDKTIITCHDLIPLILRGRYRSLVPWWSNRAYRDVLEGLLRARALLVNSPCTQRDVVKYLGYPAEKIHLTPLGIDEAMRPLVDPGIRSDLRRQLGLPLDKALLLHVGLNVFYKNIEGLLRGVAILAYQRKIPLRLVRAGPFLTGNQLKLARKLRISDLLIELGPLDRSKLIQLYQASDVFVFPSLYEGLGLPPLEAMACGLTTAVSNRGALPETVSDAALLFDPDTPSDIADAVQRLLEDEKLRVDLRLRGFTRSGKFKWAATAEGTWNAYRTVFS